MAGFAKAFKVEVVRLSRHEVKVGVAGMKKNQVSLRRSLAVLRRQLAALEKAGRALQRDLKAPLTSGPDTAEEKAGRITAKGIRSLRRKLGMSRAKFALLVGTTGQSVYNWEKAARPLRLRRSTRQSLLEVRGLGKREAAEKLAGKASKAKTRGRGRR
jgi:DNA-binding transcriptional regulator YiaG